MRRPPASTKSGEVEAIGEAIETGRCFTAKYVQTQLAVTIADLSSNSRCCAPVKCSVTNLAGNTPGRRASNNNSAVQMDAEQKVLRNKTGNTAFPRTACLLQSS